MPTVDLALRLVRSPRRRWLGTEGLALVGAIADESESTDAEVRDLREATAALAAELGEDRTAHERWTLLADQLPPGSCSGARIAGRRAGGLRAQPGAASRLAIERARAVVVDDPRTGSPSMRWRRRSSSGSRVDRRTVGRWRGAPPSRPKASRTLRAASTDFRRGSTSGDRCAEGRLQAAVQDDQWRVVGDIAAA